MLNYELRSPRLKTELGTGNTQEVGKRQRLFPYSVGVTRTLPAALDFIAIAALGWFSYRFLDNGFLAAHGGVLLTISFIVAGLYVLALHLADLYNPNTKEKLLILFRKILLSSVVVFGGTQLLLRALQVSLAEEILWYASWFLLALLFGFSHRVLWIKLLRYCAVKRLMVRNLIIVGAGKQAQEILKRLDTRGEPWIRVLGLFDDRASRVGPDIHGHQVLGSVEDVLEFTRNNEVDDIIIALPWSAGDRLQQIIDRLMELPVNIRLGSDLIGFSYSTGKSVHAIGRVPMMNAVSKPFTGWRYLVKSLEDRFLASIFILLLSPLMLLIALIVKLQSRGPVLFKQRRHGFNNQEFSVYKFRSMVHDATPKCGMAELQIQRNDPRTTRIGEILRKTSLDELPQLFNVLEGSMSLIGPRPHPIPLNEKYAPVVARYFVRHKVKPGITGWAQVNGLRGPVWGAENMQARVEHDIYYIDNWSVLLDIKIIFLTFFRGMTGENTY
jgi:Undecaprenyl-phosphate glucose phosphotransferase